MEGIPVRITEPELVDVLNTVKNGSGCISLADLRRKIGRRRADKGISQAKICMMQIKFALAEYLDNPLKCEWEFFKEVLGIQSGKTSKHLKIIDNTDIREIPDNSLMVMIKTK